MSNDSARCEALERENAALREQIDAIQQNTALMQEKYAERETEYCNVIAKFKKITIQLQNEIKHLQQENEAADYYKHAYAAFDEAFKKFLGLPENLRSRLAGIFGDGATPQGFLAGGLQIENLDKFYDLIFSELNVEAIPDSGRVLCEIFDFCFEMANAGGREPIYERLVDVTGADYDSDTMIRTAKGSRQLGSVIETRLCGYCHWRTKVVQRRSLVVVG